MADLSELRFFRTPSHACSYLEDKRASTLFVDPKAVMDQHVYSELSQMGFRRSGDYLYRPHCDGCQACIPARVRVNDFRLKRRHRRVLAKNAGWQCTEEPARYTREVYALYARYIEARHGDGDMYPPSEEQFSNFLLCDWADTSFYCFREQGLLRAVAVTDHLSDGLSAVYTFFDPALADNSPGVQSLLTQIELTRQQGLPYLYLGYWISGCQKMKYKSEYQPLEILQRGKWQELLPE